MGRNTSFRLQQIEKPEIVPQQIAGITIPQINYGTSVGGSQADLIQSRANAIFTEILFSGNQNDGLTEDAGGGALNRFLGITEIRGANSYSSLLSSSIGDNGTPYIIDWDNDMEFTILFRFSNSTDPLFATLGISASGLSYTGLSTFRHAALEINGTNAYASVGDGTSQNKSAAITGLDLTKWNKLRIKFVAGAKAEFYINDNINPAIVLDDNIPSGNTTLPQLFIGARNNNGAGTSVTMHCCNNYTLKVKL